MTRMKILSAAEQAVFDAPPLFNHHERKQFLEFPTVLLAMAANFRQPVNQVCFLISCGYFRATQQFFPPADYHPRDVAYVSNQLAVDGILTEGYTDRTRQRHQKLILEFYGFHPFDSRSEALLKVEISAMARLHLKPRLIFDRCTDFLIQKHIQVPKAGTITELVRLGRLEAQDFRSALIVDAVARPQVVDDDRHRVVGEAAPVDDRA